MLSFTILFSGVFCEFGVCGFFLAFFSDLLLLLLLLQPFLLSPAKSCARTGSTGTSTFLLTPPLAGIIHAGRGPPPPAKASKSKLRSRNNVPVYYHPLTALLSPLPHPIVPGIIRPIPPANSHGRAISLPISTPPCLPRGDSVTADHPLARLSHRRISVSRLDHVA